MSQRHPERSADHIVGGWLHSPLTLLVLVVACAALLWIKLDTISQHLATHRHSPESGNPENPGSHSHANSGTDPGVSDQPHQHGPFHAASHPPTGELSLVPEWAPTQSLALALPQTHHRDEEYLRLLADLSAACLEHSSVDVLILIEQNDVTARARCDAWIEERKLDRQRIMMHEAKSLDTIWIRDYGPIFVRRPQNQQLFVVDTAYRDPRLAIDEAASVLAGMTSGLRAADDLVPMYFATLLDKTYVHPGFALNGGDLYADGQGALYTSEETLHLNTGDRDFVEQAFRRFLGVRRPHFLRSLPGPTVKHIDMFFKLVSTDACLVGEYRPAESEDEELVSLQRAAGEILDANAAQLSRLGLRVERMPMPPISRISKWEFYGIVLGEADRQRRVELMAEDAKLPPQTIRRKLEEKPHYVYRTWLNSILVEPGSGERKRTEHARLLIVPDYRHEATRDQKAAVEAQYRQTYGEPLNIAFVDAETLAHGNGSLRCIVCQIPE